MRQVASDTEIQKAIILCVNKCIFPTAKNNLNICCRDVRMREDKIDSRVSAYAYGVMNLNYFKGSLSHFVCYLMFFLTAIILHFGNLITEIQSNILLEFLFSLIS